MLFRLWMQRKNLEKYLSENRCPIAPKLLILMINFSLWNLSMWTAFDLNERPISILHLLSNSCCVTPYGILLYIQWAQSNCESCRKFLLNNIDYVMCYERAIVLPPHCDIGTSKRDMWRGFGWAAHKFWSNFQSVISRLVRKCLSCICFNIKKLFSVVKEVGWHFSRRSSVREDISFREWETMKEMLFFTSFACRNFLQYFVCCTDDFNGKRVKIQFVSDFFISSNGRREMYLTKWILSWVSLVIVLTSFPVVDYVFHTSNTCPIDVTHRLTIDWGSFHWISTLACIFQVLANKLTKHWIVS